VILLLAPVLIWVFEIRASEEAIALITYCGAILIAYVQWDSLKDEQKEKYRWPMIVGFLAIFLAIAFALNALRPS